MSRSQQKKIQLVFGLKSSTVWSDIQTEITLVEQFTLPGNQKLYLMKVKIAQPSWTRKNNHYHHQFRAQWMLTTECKWPENSALCKTNRAIVINPQNHRQINAKVFGQRRKPKVYKVCRTFFYVEYLKWHASKLGKTSYQFIMKPIPH